ncbi:aromatic prenyltransferase [Purpureocillium lilacinum]|nr:aromatic prenyltransferase [Purpureocillium lilacinum]OAQ79632.1 aromatic prenyltransferase [Purpureocillium lilacinum]OAQ88968.1 aromatic prenyltransferase [Purpureocillium lilacinum]
MPGATTTAAATTDVVSQTHAQGAAANGSLDSKVSKLQQPLDVVNSVIRFHNRDHQFWWDKSGPHLAELLAQARYPKADQYSELLFYALHVVPELGPSPDPETGHMRWRSPQTPDGTPIDFSWEWGPGGRGVVRTSFEPIGPLAGTPADPANARETDAWIRHLDAQGLVSGLDLQWYRHFSASVLPSDVGRVRLDDKLNFELAPQAGTFVTRDISRRGDPMVKLYMFPGLRAQALGAGVSNLDVVTRAVQTLPPDQLEHLNAGPLLDYLHEAAARWGMETGIFSFDLVDPRASRIKIYTRAPATTVEYLLDALSLGGRYDLATAYSPEALADVKDFWRIFIGEDAPDVMPSGGKERDGPGFYFTVGGGKPASAKVYISPMSFCKSDAEVLQRLRQYFSTRRDAEDMLPQMDNYERALQNIYGTELLESHVGSHFYVSCALQKDQLRIVTYLCPQILAQETAAREARKGQQQQQLPQE